MRQDLVASNQIHIRHLLVLRHSIVVLRIIVFLYMCQVFSPCVPSVLALILFDSRMSQTDLFSVIDEAAASLGYTCLKDEQKKALHSFVSGKDVFVSLPTGYGKSLCYALLPIVFDKIRGIDSTALVANSTNSGVISLPDKGCLLFLAFSTSTPHARQQFMATSTL